MARDLFMSERRAIGESPILRVLLILAAAAFLFLGLILPLAFLAAQAFAAGWSGYFGSLTAPDTASSIRLTLLIAAFVVPANTLFGLAASWCIAKFRFPGRAALLTVIDLPISVSPVIAGLVFVLIFGAQGWLGPVLTSHGIRVIFAVPGLVLATAFVTVPFVARQLIPLMEQQGSDEEECALVLGATGLQTFWRVTLPNIRWGLLYGVLLCNARAMGEFGAVSVVSGHIRGATMTMPLQVEALYQDYNSVAAFAVASLLALLAVVTLVVKRLVEWHHRRETAIQSA